MFEELFEIAKNKLAGIDEPVVGFPEPQATVLFTHNKNFYVAVNDMDGCICDALKRKNDTKIVRALTMWKSGQIDLPSFQFQKALVALDQYNYDTDILLQGNDGFIIKKLWEMMPR